MSIRSQAHEAFADGDWDTAAELYKQIADIDPEDGTSKYLYLISMQHNLGVAGVELLPELLPISRQYYQGILAASASSADKLDLIAQMMTAISRLGIDLMEKVGGLYMVKPDVDSSDARAFLLGERMLFTFVQTFELIGVNAIDLGFDVQEQLDFILQTEKYILETIGNALIQTNIKLDDEMLDWFNKARNSVAVSTADKFSEINSNGNAEYGDSIISRAEKAMHEKDWQKAADLWRRVSEENGGDGAASFKALICQAHAASYGAINYLPELKPMIKAYCEAINQTYKTEDQASRLFNEVFYMLSLLGYDLAFKVRDHCLENENASIDTWEHFVESEMKLYDFLKWCVQLSEIAARNFADVAESDAALQQSVKAAPSVVNEVRKQTGMNLNRDQKVWIFDALDLW